MLWYETWLPLAVMGLETSLGLIFLWASSFGLLIFPWKQLWLPGAWSLPKDWIPLAKGNQAYVVLSLHPVSSADY